MNLKRVKKPNQSGSENIKNEVNRAIAHARGGTLTKVARESTFKNFFLILKTKLNIQIRSFKHITAAHIGAYIKYRLEAKKSKRTLQNNMSHIRSALCVHGRTDFAESDKISNTYLGIGGASRDGTHRIADENFISTSILKVEKENIGVSVCLRLQRVLGLRAREAVMSNKSLRDWLRALKSGRPIHVIFGTKGGRPRTLLPAELTKAIQVIELAIKLTKLQSGKLIVSTKLKAAMHKYWRICSKNGLNKEFSGHMLRYTFALDKFILYLEQGHSEKNALALVSQDLGHGDGRGRYIRQVYLKHYFDNQS